MTLLTRVVTVEGRPTEIRTAGDREPLVFLHGGGGPVEGFDFLEPLSHRFRVVAPLRPGYGASELDPPLTSPDQMTQFFCDVLDELHIDRMVLVGHSLGGWLAARLAARFPARVSELVLAAPFGMNLPGHLPANMMAMSPAERYAALTNKPEIWEGRVPTGRDPEFTAARGREMEAMGRFMPGPFDPDLASVLAQIDAPAQLLWGEDDKIIPVANAAEWRTAIAFADARIFPATGHMLFHERPETLAAVEEFVDSRRS